MMKSRFHPSRHPRLASFLSSGDIFRDGCRYVGRLPDGTTRPLGDVGLEKDMEHLLFLFQTPSRWAEIGKKLMSPATEARRKAYQAEKEAEERRQQ